jgi:3-methyl-2-oxobutanoate hydroxymethyltransferase
MLGLNPWVPKFVKKFGNLGPMIEEAVSDYAAEVKTRNFPGPDNMYQPKK